MTSETTKIFTVQGMTCGHCAQSVQEEVSQVSGVAFAEVLLAEGQLTVSGPDVDEAAVAAAVREAGYEVAA